MPSCPYPDSMHVARASVRQFGGVPHFSASEWCEFQGAPSDRLVALRRPRGKSRELRGELAGVTPNEFAAFYSDTT
jgi:hypothetical protein